jgi:hypothetical protein
MTIRQFVLTVVTIVFIGVAIAFLWVQVGLPSDILDSPWDPAIHVFPSIYALWIPLIYLFFTGIWIYLSRKYSDEEIRFFLRFDRYSYAAVLIFFLLQVSWREFGSPALWLRGFVLGLLLLKSALLFRMLYRYPQRIQPILLVILGICLHIFLFPFAYQTFALSIPDLFQRTEFLHLATIATKSLCLNLMTMEMFRLGTEMAKSEQSAFFSWVIVTFTFPVIGFPKTSYILAGLFIIFVLRMVFSRLDTRELMFGLLTPTNIMILLKLLLILAVLTAAGLVFWSNIRPGFGFRSGRALQAVTSIFFDGQSGLLCYTPMYWFACFGIIYLLFFKVWDGLLLIMTGGILYIGYHLAVYGILGKIVEQSDIIPFLPILGVFIAIAHYRFGKMMVFRYGIRFAIFVTIGITSLLIVLHPNLTQISTKIAEIQRAVITSLERDITYIVPSTVFRPFSGIFFIWTGLIVVLALIFCNSRTRAVSLVTRRTKRVLEQYFYFREFSFSPCLLFVFLTMGILIIHYGDSRQPLPLDQPIHLSRSQRQQEIPIKDSFRSKGILIVSNVTGGLMAPHKTPVANLIILGQEQRFESFTMKVGEDTSEERLEERGMKDQIAHGRSAIYRSWNIETGDGTSFPAHEYYTKFLFSRPLEAQKIILKFLNPNPEEQLSEIALHIKEIALLH